jgi:hypothetical protein
VESDSDTDTKASEKWCDEKDICLKAGRSVVAVSSVGPGKIILLVSLLQFVSDNY